MIKAHKGGSVSFGNGKRGYIIGIKKVGKSLGQAIDDGNFLKGLKFSLLSVSQIYDKGNGVKFIYNKSMVTRLKMVKLFSQP